MDLELEIYLKGDLEKVWRALIDPNLTEKYVFGCHIKSNFKEGSKLEYVDGDQIHVSGQVLKFEPRKRFSHTINGPQGAGASNVEYSLTEMGEVTKISLSHSEIGTDIKRVEMFRRNWALLLSGLKTVVETGAPLFANKNKLLSAAS